MRKIIWTGKMKAYISQNYLLLSRKDIAAHLGFDPGVIKRYMANNGLVVPKTIAEKIRVRKMVGRTSFTAEQDAVIKRDYLIKTPAKIALDVNKSEAGVIRSLKRLGLVIPKEITLQRIADSRIKPGDVPANKGKKQTEWLTAEQIELTKATRFKKGNMPPQTLGEGVITIRKDSDGKNHQWIHFDKRRCVELQRYNYEKFIGEIPQGHIVTFKDGDTMNCCPFNLKLISRAENAVRNSGTQELKDIAVASYLATTSRKFDPELRAEILKHPELIELKRTELLLTREIKKHERANQ